MALTKIPASLLDTSSGFDLQGNITLGDSEKIRLGDGPDLDIYHDGSNSYIEDLGDGVLFVKASGGIYFNGKTTDEPLARFIENGAVNLYYDNDLRIATSSAGATVAGTLTVTGNLDITGDINSYNVTDLDVTDQTITLGAGQTEANSGGSGIIIDGSNASILWNETNNRFDLSNDLKVGAEDGGQFSLEISGGATGTPEGGELRLNTAADYDGTYNHYRLDVYEDDLRIGRAGTTDITLDSSGNVGIGTTSPSDKLEIGTTTTGGNLRLVSSSYANNGLLRFFGTDNVERLQMGALSGTAAYIYTPASTDLVTYTGGSQKMRIDANGEISMGWSSGGGPGGGLLQVNGGGLFTNGGAGYVQGSILLRSSDNDSTPSYRGQGVFTWNVGSQVSWFIGTPYTDGDLFTINRKSSESSFTQESSYIGHANTNNFFTIKNNGCVGLGNVNPTESLYVGNINAGGADVSLALQNSISNRNSSLKIYDESGNNKVNLNYDNGSNRGTLSMGDADGEIIYVYEGSSIKSGFGIDLSGSSRELSIFHTSSGTDGNIALGKRLESNGTFSASVQITPAGTAGTANLIVNNVNSNAFNHIQENKVPNLTAGEDVFLGIGKATSTKNMGYLGYEWNASGSDSNYIHLSHWGADGLLRVYGNGNYSFAGSNVSDRDLKENIISVSDTALDKITQLEVRKFNFIKDYEVSSDGTEVETPRTQVGFIAQEVEAIIPDITVGTDGQKDMGVDTVGLVAYLTIAIQEQQTIIDNLKTRIETLEG
jgi:hypothetical protein